MHRKRCRALNDNVKKQKQNVYVKKQRPEKHCASSKILSLKMKRKMMRFLRLQVADQEAARQQEMRQLDQEVDHLQWEEV